jgi:hypothetical protein
MRYRKVVHILVAVVLLLPLSGCGYSLSGRGSFLPAWIKVIGVPLFRNNTNVFDLERRVTDKVRAELAGRGKYRVEPRDAGVDAVLSGEITSVTIGPAAVNERNQATRYVLTLTANIEFKTIRDNKVLWSNPSLQFREEYDVSNTTTATDPAAFLGNDINALERLASAFARTIVSSILEAF